MRLDLYRYPRHSDVLKHMIEELVDGEDWDSDYLSQLAMHYDQTKEAEEQIGQVCSTYDLPFQARRLGIHS